jgi:protein TonB
MIPARRMIFGENITRAGQAKEPCGNTGEGQQVWRGCWQCPSRSPPSASGFAQELPRSGVTPPRVVKQVKAIYTPEARAAGIQGTVTLDVLVLKDGRVGDDVQVIRSLDTKYGLDEQAVAACRQWIFKPATKNGRPIELHVTIEQTFHID